MFNNIGNWKMPLNKIGFEDLETGAINASTVHSN